MDEKVQNIFTKIMGFEFVCIENVKDQSRNQQLYYKNKNKESNYLMNNNESYMSNAFIDSETISLLSFTKKENNINNNIYYLNNYKYMNNFPIYAILNGQKELLLVDFKDKKYKFDPSNLISKENPILILFFPEIKNMDELKLKLNENSNNNILDMIEDSLFLDYYNKNEEYKNISSFGLSKIDLNIYFENILYTKIDNYCYNRISSNEINIIKDKENDITLYNIPCLNKINNILIFEVNEKIKSILFDNNLNIQELMINYFNKILKEKKNDDEDKSNNIVKTTNMYIPSFSIETHLESIKVSKNINNIEIYQNLDENQIPLKIGTIDEYMKINFKKKKSFYRQIKFDINNDNNKDNDFIIKNDFILGIMNNYIGINYPLFQLIIVPKEYWIKEGNEFV